MSNIYVATARYVLYFIFFNYELIAVAYQDRIDVINLFLFDNREWGIK